MDGEENKVNTDEEEEEASEADISTAAVDGNEKEEITETAASHHEEPSETEKVKEEEEATYKTEGNTKMNEVSEQPPPQEEEVIFELDSSNEEGPSVLHLDTPERENTSSAQEEEEDEEEEEEAGENKKYEEHLQILKELCKERDKALQQNRQIQAKLLAYFHKRHNRGVGSGTRTVEMQLKHFNNCMAMVAKLKHQSSVQSVIHLEQIERLTSLSDEMLDKVEKEWQALVALKKNVVLKTLTQSLSRQAAQAKVESALAIEQRHQDELTKRRLYNSKVQIKIGKLQTELRGWDQHTNEALQKEIDRVRTKNQERQKEAEEKYEESLKLLKKITSNLEPMSNIKEKLRWSQDDIQDKQQKLDELEAMVTKKRDLLTRTKQAHNKLQRTTQKLREHRGLLGNMILLRDFEDTVDATDHLEEQLRNLKLWQAEAGRFKKKLETT